MDFPVSFTEKMKDILGDEYEDFLKGYDRTRHYGLRVNRSKLTADQFARMSMYDLQPVPWIDNAFEYEDSVSPAKHPYYFAGMYYLQEPSAMTPANLLPIEPGDKVLDLCAAPGGKATELGAKLNHTGLLVANDISNSRAKALLKNIELFGIPNVLVTSEPPEKLAGKFPAFFDKILIDAPCSGEGMFRKNESATKSWEAYGVQHCANLQRTILEDAVTLLKSDGMILYSTCTFSPEENEGMIDEFLKKHPDFKVVPLTPVGGIMHGRPDFIDADPQLEGALRLWPHHLEGEGHFVCLLQRTGGEAGKCPGYGKQKRLKDYPDALAFMEQYTHLSPDVPVTEISGKLYSIPEDAPDLKGVRVIRGGLLLGELKNKRFEPSHVLTLAYPKEMFKQTIEWSLQDEAIMRYLKGETILCDRPKGYYVVCVDGYPLGWVKAQNGMLKNQYPASWRLC